MEDVCVCAPLLAEADAQSNITSSPNAASVTDADTVINTKLHSSQVEGEKCKGDLMKDLLTDDYCHVCEAVLLFQSQRLSHYEGKKHAQKVKMYLQAKRVERTITEPTAPQPIMIPDKHRFCELCKMVFSSHLVAKSHYEGKVHAKNLRKQGLLPQVINRHTEVCAVPRLTDNTDQSSASDGGTEHHEDPAATTVIPSADVDLMDPNKYCSLCTASFNKPQMALQHYNGRKHQRNQARQDLMKELGDDVQQDNLLVCQMCSLQFNSVEMYKAHVQGSKHQIREKKVVDLCKSQQKIYDTYADELADYIAVQKARGINPKAKGAPREEEQEEEAEEATQEVLNKIINPPHRAKPGCYYLTEGFHPPYWGPAWPPPTPPPPPPPPRPPFGWDYSCPPPRLPHFTSWPMKNKRYRKQSSSSSCTNPSSFSYSSSRSSSASDSGDTECRQRERRRVRRSKKERGRRTREEKRQRTEQAEKTLGKREESEESEQERRRKKHKKDDKWRQNDNKSREEEGGAAQVMDSLEPQDLLNNRKFTKVHIQTENNAEQMESGQEAKAKFRKEKKKVKAKLDSRTEEEKLWDDSILGC